MSGLALDQHAAAHEAEGTPRINLHEHFTASATLSAKYAGKTCTNLGAIGPVTFTLPTAVKPGTPFTFKVLAAQTLTISPGAAGAFYIDGAKQTDAVTLSSATIGDTITVEAAGDGDWSTGDRYGSWLSAAGVGGGTVATVTGLSGATVALGPNRYRTTLTLAAVVTAVADGSNAEFGSVALYAFPTGIIAIEAAYASLAIAAGPATADGDIAVGTTAQTDVAVGNITAAQNNILKVAAFAQLSGGAGTFLAANGARETALDGSAGALSARLNVLLDQGAGADANMTMTGTVQIDWRLIA